MARGKSKKVAENPIAYVITDKYFPDFEVKNTANAWWLDKSKVQNLIQAFKWDCTIEEACANAGITLAMYRYFNESHPNFSHVKDLCKQLVFIAARRTISLDLELDSKVALEFMKNKKNKEFSTRENQDINASITLEDLLGKLKEEKDVL